MNFAEQYGVAGARVADKNAAHLYSRLLDALALSPRPPRRFRYSLARTGPL